MRVHRVRAGWARPSRRARGTACAAGSGRSRARRDRRRRRTARSRSPRRGDARGSGMPRTDPAPTWPLPTSWNTDFGVCPGAAARLARAGTVVRRGTAQRVAPERRDRRAANCSPSHAARAHTSSIVVQPELRGRTTPGTPNEKSKPATTGGRCCNDEIERLRARVQSSLSTSRSDPRTRGDPDAGATRRFPARRTSRSQ